MNDTPQDDAALVAGLEADLMNFLDDTFDMPREDVVRLVALARRSLEPARATELCAECNHPRSAHTLLDGCTVALSDDTRLGDCGDCPCHTFVPRPLEGTATPTLDLGEGVTWLSVEQERNRNLVHSLQVLANPTTPQDIVAVHVTRIREAFARMQAALGAGVSRDTPKTAWAAEPIRRLDYAAREYGRRTMAGDDAPPDVVEELRDARNALTAILESRDTERLDWLGSKTWYRESKGEANAGIRHEMHTSLIDTAKRGKCDIRAAIDLAQRREIDAAAVRDHRANLCNYRSRQFFVGSDRHAARDYRCAMPKGHDPKHAAALSDNEAIRSQQPDGEPVAALPLPEDR